jgi:hypothetical protein
VTELLEVFGVKPGQEGVGMEPNIPAFLKKDLALPEWRRCNPTLGGV